MILCFREYLTCPQNMPLHEVMYFDSLSTVKQVRNPTISFIFSFLSLFIPLMFPIFLQHLIGMPRVAIQTALTNPHHYLKVGLHFANHTCIQKQIIFCLILVGKLVCFVCLLF